MTSNYTQGDVVRFDALCGEDDVFWNYTANLARMPFPYVSICFQNTAITWLSCFLLWLISPFYIYHLHHKKGPEVDKCRQAKRSVLNILKLTVGGVQILMPFLEMVVIGSMASVEDVPGYLVASIIRFLTMIIAWSLMAIEFQKAKYTSGVLLFYWLVYSLLNAISMYAFNCEYHDPGMRTYEKTYYGLNAVAYGCSCLQFFLHCLNDPVILNVMPERDSNPNPSRSTLPLVRSGGNDRVGNSSGSGTESGSGTVGVRSGAWNGRGEGRDGSEDTMEGDLRGNGGGGDRGNRDRLIDDSLVEGERGTNTEDEVYWSPYHSALSSLFFIWILPLFWRGLKRPHTTKDLPEVPREHLCSAILPPFQRKFEEAVEKNKNNDRKMSSIYMRCLLKHAAPVIIFWGFVRLLTIVLLIVNLLIFRKLIAFVKNRDDIPTHTPWMGYLYAFSLLLVAFIRGLSVAQWLFGCDKAGMQLKILISTTVYRKMLKLSNSYASTMDIGYISNLMSIDSLKLSQSVRSFHEVSTLPVYLALALWFFYGSLQVSGVIGMAFMIIVVPLVTFLIAGFVKKLQENQMFAKDRRLKIISEVLAGIKILKLYAWEDPFENKVNEYRGQEMKSIYRSSFLNAISTTVCLIAPFMVSLIVFSYYVFMQDSQLDSGNAFVCLSLICMLNCNISTLPSSISFVIQGYISLKRTAGLMDIDEVQGDRDRTFVENGPAIEIENGTFSWVEGQKNLKNINISIAPGKLVAIVGSVGSGKSSMLAAMLGEMRKVGGSIRIQQNSVYVSQQAWIRNCTIRDNICLNRHFDKNKYNKIVKACCLTEDLEGFPGGDLTEIGGRGANLSGGQRQRVNLARGVYTKADLYLIDDTLSAVDPRMAQKIFNNVISREGILRKKTRIFATNSLGLLPEVDHIIVMNEGVIESTGTYEELINSKGSFADFLNQHLKNSSYLAHGDLSVQKKLLNKALSYDPKKMVRATVTDLSRGFSTANRMSTYSRRINSTRTSVVPKRFDYRQQLTAVDDMDIGGEYDPDEFISNTEATSRLVTADKVATGSLDMGIVLQYLKSGGLFLFFLLVIGHVAMLLSQSASYVWIQRWTDNSSNTTNQFYVGMYGIIGSVELVAIIINAFCFAYGFSSASRTLHDKAVNRLFRAPLSHFDTTSPGQTLNNLSTDMDTVDCALPLDIQLWLISFSVVVCSVGTIAYADPIYLAITLPIIFISAIVQRIYGKSAIQLRREYAVKKTPVYSHFEETIAGSMSIRSYRKQIHFIEASDKLVDDSHKPWYSYLICWRWYTLYNEMMGVLALFLTAITAVALEHQRNSSNPSNQVSAGQIGLVLFSIFQILPHIPIASRMMIEIEAHIVAVERLVKCANIAQEAPRKAKPGQEPRITWPENGRIEFQNFCVKHRPDLDNVLKNLTLNIEQHEMVGVCGRAGAGKSSIILSLFRMIEGNEGSIKIDGVNIAEIGLHDLRSKITCIPQEPILFCGTLRYNLDPHMQYTDSQMWKALEQAQLRELIKNNMEQGLDFVIDREDTFCVGQKQQICLARALLRNSRLIVLDEATASVDYETDQMIQAIIRKEFSNSTVLTVAHRLDTIKDYDKVLVLQQGALLEFDSPGELLKQPNSTFAQMERADQSE